MDMTAQLAGILYKVGRQLSLYSETGRDGTRRDETGRDGTSRDSVPSSCEV